jgi:hypothetical protein
MKYNGIFVGFSIRSVVSLRVPWILFFSSLIIASISNCLCNRMSHLRQKEERIPFVNEVEGNVKE